MTMKQKRPGALAGALGAVSRRARLRRKTRPYRRQWQALLRCGSEHRDRLAVGEVLARPELHSDLGQLFVCCVARRCGWLVDWERHTLRLLRKRCTP